MMNTKTLRLSITLSTRYNVLQSSFSTSSTVRLPREKIKWRNHNNVEYLKYAPNLTKKQLNDSLNDGPIRTKIHSGSRILEMIKGLFL